MTETADESITRERDEMEPMKPMKPMAPMKPMTPLSKSAPWWPADLGEPATSGSQNGMRYAFFPEKKRLLIEDQGKLATYDSADHRIDGVSQQGSHDQNLVFTSQKGIVDLNELKQID